MSDIGGPRPDFDEVWRRIIAHATEEFRQVRGGVFTYLVDGNVVIPDRTDYQFARSEFIKAYERMPVSGPGALQDLRGPSYLFAILMDDRIRRDQW